MVEQLGIDGVYGALTDTSRRTIIERLAQDGEVRVTDLADRFPVSSNAVSKRVKVLERAGLVGGRFRLVMAHGGTSVEHLGEYRAIEPPSLLAFTWRSEFTGQLDTLVTVRFTALSANQTQLELTHDLLPDSQADSHAEGWRLI